MKIEKCACGCGKTPRRGRFLPGHDARLRSKLIGKVRHGSHKAKAQLRELGWKPLVEAGVTA